MSKPGSMQASDYAFENRRILQPAKITRAEAAEIRKQSYRDAGYRWEDYRHPPTARLTLLKNSLEAPMLTPYVGGLDIYAVRERARRILAYVPDAVVYVTIPSKANTQERPK